MLFFPSRNSPHSSPLIRVRVLITRTLLFLFVIRLFRVLPIFTNLTSFSLLLHFDEGGCAISFFPRFSPPYLHSPITRPGDPLHLPSSSSSSVAVARGSTNHLSRIDHTWGEREYTFELTLNNHCLLDPLGFISFFRFGTAPFLLLTNCCFLPAFARLFSPHTKEAQFSLIFGLFCCWHSVFFIITHQLTLFWLLGASA